MIIKRETWGYSLWFRREQIGAGVGLPVEFHLRRSLSKQEARQWRKHGIIKV